MGFVFRRRKRLSRTTAANVSTAGASITKRAGRVSLSSRGRGTVRIAKGIGFRFKL